MIHSTQSIHLIDISIIVAYSKLLKEKLALRPNLQVLVEVIKNKISSFKIISPFLKYVMVLPHGNQTAL